MVTKQSETAIEEKLICSECTNEVFLRAEIQQRGERGICSYCGVTRETVNMDDLADYFDGAFERHFYRTSTQPNDYEYMLLKDRESSFEFERHGNPVLHVIQEIGEVSEELADDLLSILGERHGDYENDKMGEESEFDSDSHYAERKISIAELHSQWMTFQRSVQSESRFFNNTALEFLDSMFSELQNDGTRDGKEAIVDGGPGTLFASLYRARVFQSEPAVESALKRPDRELSAPPFRFAKAGRMNAHGVSLFYGATDRLVAIAEVRPPVGSRALTGEFQLLRPIKLLDLEALRSIYVDGSYFDPRYESSLQRAKFLGFMSQEMAKPVMPEDESFSYLPTQVIADYLANSRFGLDGIIYPSVQGKEGGRNVALFHAAARAKDFEFPEGTDISASSTLDPDYDTSYVVFVSTPAASRKVTKPHGQAVNRLRQMEDLRQPTLELLAESVKVHHVKGIEFACEDYDVRRHTSTQDRIRRF